MSSRTTARIAASTLSVLALVGGTVSAVSAQPGDAPAGKSGATKTAAPAAPASLATGVVVRTSKAAPSDGDVARLARAASAPADAATAIDKGLVTIAFDSPVPVSEAAATAAAIAQVPGVVYAEPDLILTRSTTAPGRPNDTYFDRQVGVWDKRNFSTTSAPGWTAGGFSVRAPYLWRATKGSTSKVVAVIDTGFTSHADLNANRVAGYDFVSSTADPTAASGRDGDAPASSPVPGWDANAADPGDYLNAGQCGSPSATNSSWHGTHVAGIVAAVDANKTGISGVAPNAKFQPIRALGPCGGATSDIATAIKWAAGVPVSGVPANKTPAKVVNLSLGGGSTCPSVLQDAITAARGQGAVVVAAAGNESVIGISSPANCVGALAVTATDEYGQSASYSNVGDASRRADISAPGGDSRYEGYSGILSTINKGSKTPGAAGYTEYDGTSMATPHVAAGAILLSSLGYSGADIETSIKRAVRPFAVYGGGAAQFNCRSSTTAGPTEWDCGTGILDLGKVPALYGSKTITGTAKSGSTLSIGTSANTGTRTYQWFRSGTAITGATASTYKLKNLDKGKQVSVKVTVAKDGFKTLTVTAAARKVAS